LERRSEMSWPIERPPKFHLEPPNGRIAPIPAILKNAAAGSERTSGTAAHQS
jgi:hypothetical protein